MTAKKNITVTSLRLKSLWGFFPLSWWGFKITLQAMKNQSTLASEVKILSYQGDSLPDWKAAKAMVAENGRIFS